MPIPAAPVCLTTPYCAKPEQKGGTLIAEEVRGIDEHRRLLETDGYRPEGCPRCDRFLHGAFQRGEESWPVFDLFEFVESNMFLQAAAE